MGGLIEAKERDFLGGAAVVLVQVRPAMALTNPLRCICLGLDKRSVSEKSSKLVGRGWIFSKEGKYGQGNDC